MKQVDYGPAEGQRPETEFLKPCHSVNSGAKFAPRQAIKLIACGKLTFDERAIPPPCGFERLVGAKVVV